MAASYLNFNQENISALIQGIFSKIKNEDYVKESDVKQVAKSGKYVDLTDRPTATVEGNTLKITGL